LLAARANEAEEALHRLDVPSQEARAPQERKRMEAELGVVALMGSTRRVQTPFSP